MENIIAWHFAREDRKLRYGDGREIKRGAVFEGQGPISTCRRGLHGSIKPLDALDYAPGCTVSRTEHSGHILIEDDKIVSSVREHVAVADAKLVLVQFANWCADRAVSYSRYDPRAARAANEAVSAAMDSLHTSRNDAVVFAVRRAARWAREAIEPHLGPGKYGRAMERDAQNAYLEEKLLDLIQRYPL